MKKILIVNTVLFGEPGGTGSIIKNIFGSYPEDCLMQLHIGFEQQNVKNCIRTVYLKKSDIPLDCAARKLLYAVIKFSQEKIGRGLINHITETNLVIVKKSLKNCLYNFLRGLLDASHIRLNGEIKKAISEFAPDVIYTCGGTIRIHRTVNKISKRLGIPVILHLMDDWPETSYTASVLSLPFRRRLLRELKITNSLSVINFAISQNLCEKYGKKYNRNYVPLLNPAVRFADMVAVSDMLPLKFVYVGSVAQKRWRSLLDIAKVVSEINRMQKSIDFEIYVPPSANNGETAVMFAEYDVKIFDYVPYDQMFRLYSGADVLVFTESFEKEFVNFTRNSFSTKIPEYMASGKPILAYLPQQLCSYSYLKVNGAAETAYSGSGLRDAVFLLLRSPERRRALAEKALLLAKAEHSGELAYKKLLDAVNTGKSTAARV